MTADPTVLRPVAVVDLQCHQLYMAVCFWYLVKSVRYCTRVHWINHFLQGTRKTLPCLSGPVGLKRSALLNLIRALIPWTCAWGLRIFCLPEEG